MKYKLELITDLTVLDELIAEKQDFLFILRNERDDSVIQSNKSVKGLKRRADSIQDAQTRITTATAISASIPDGTVKIKQLGIIETQRARLFNLNAPTIAGSPSDVVDSEIDKEEQMVLIAFHQDVLDTMLLRKGEL